MQNKFKVGDIVRINDEVVEALIHKGTVNGITISKNIKDEI